MADAIQQALGVDVEVIKGARGVFEVSVDGRVVAQKSMFTGFPTAEQCVEAVRAVFA